MNDSELEQRLLDAFADARTTVDPSADLFVRTTHSLADAKARHQFRWRLTRIVGGFAGATTALALVLVLSNFNHGRFTVKWWVIELISNIVLVGLAVGLGPFIKRFGRSYAADVFKANPRTGKSYLVLTDVAYYLIFTAFILFTVTFVAPVNWRVTTGNQLKHEFGRVGGILLIMGILHAANVVALPIIGRLLSHDDRPTARPTTRPPEGSPLVPGIWTLRIESPAESEGTTGATRNEPQP